VNGVLNLSAYRFVDLDDTAALRVRMYDEAATQGLKGTILLAPEGINIVLAGEAPRVRSFVDWLRGDPRLAGLKGKESWSAMQPFRRLLVKNKREIIRMNCPTIRPAGGRAPAIGAAALARWLDAGKDDEGRPVVMLDTRNAFEVDAGSFAGAVDWRLARFSDFPAALAANRSQLEGQTVVTYCTGGIRCEKAALLMRQNGLPHVLQLDDGILGYFERTVGAPHWQGRCIVFDERQALDATLQPA